MKALEKLGLVGAGTLIGVGCLTLLFLVVCAPFIGIWSLNTLFAFDIPYTLKTYFAVLGLCLVFKSTTTTVSKS